MAYAKRELASLWAQATIVTLAACAFAPWSSAAVIQPDETASKDTAVYQFIPAFNFEGAGPTFQSVLAVAVTESGHDVRTFLQFDLAPLALTGDQLASAILHLYAIDGSTVGFPFANPTPAIPITLQVSPLLSDWQEATVNWASQPTAGLLAASTVQSGINQWLALDLTDLVRSWLDGPETNHGLLIAQDAVVTVEGLEAAGVFASASDSVASHRPYLDVTPVPEPATTLLLGLAAVAWSGRWTRRVW